MCPILRISTIRSFNRSFHSKRMGKYVLSLKTDRLRSTDVVLTTEIGEGKHNWFSCYLEPHVFDQETAAQHPEMMDFVAATYTTGAPYLLSAMVFTAGGKKFLHCQTRK